MRATKSTPAAFLVAAAFKLAVGILFALIVTYAFTERRGETAGWMIDFARYGRSLLAPAFGLGIAALWIVGFHELARRAGPGADGVVLRIGTAAAVTSFLAVLAALYIRHWYIPRAGEADGETLERAVESFWLWHGRVTPTAALVASGALLLAGRRIALVRGMALPLLITTAFAYPYRVVLDLSRGDVRSEADLWGLFVTDVAFDAGFVVSLLVVVSALARALPPAAVDLVRAGDGLQRIGSGLVARVLLLVVATFTGVSTFASSSVGLFKVTATVFPLGLLLAGIAMVTGMLQAGALSAPGAPRKRFYAAAVLTTAAFVTEALKALAAYHRVVLAPDRAEHFSGDNLEHFATALPYATPALALAGLLCLLSAVDGLRRWATEDAADPRPITSAAVAVTVFMIAGVMTLRWGVSEPNNVGVFVLVAILVAIFNVTAQLAVARVCHRVAEGMRDAPALPTAVIAKRS